ncbi:hypothetical protein [Paenibacillus cremeus]|uniref:Uncharacterized protein n=1 Tax=Paenibacillus cremeus TaxID=2163881 RepID=A0A559K857_9BACL|nr:hypothetical protein [Paenibacillus cremeus]TVY08294.1 hypothetical protein FPZ49_19710 [Paenibacillus cremeus]
MEPEQRTPREITYQVGWKRGKIVSSRDNTDGTADRQETGSAISTQEQPAGPISAAQQWNETTIWKEAPFLSGRVLQILAWGTPAVLFLLFVWMVYWLARFH